MSPRPSQDKEEKTFKTFEEKKNTFWDTRKIFHCVTRNNIIATSYAWLRGWKRHGKTNVKLKSSKQEYKANADNDDFVFFLYCTFLSPPDIKDGKRSIRTRLSPLSPICNETQPSSNYRQSWRYCFYLPIFPYYFSSPSNTMVRKALFWQCFLCSLIPDTKRRKHVTKHSQWHVIISAILLARSCFPRFKPKEQDSFGQCFPFSFCRFKFS